MENKNKKQIMAAFLWDLYKNSKKGLAILLIFLATFLSLVGIIGTNFFKINIVEFIPDSGGNKLYFLNESKNEETIIGFYMNYNEASIEEQGIAGVNLDLNFDSTKLSYQSGSLICQTGTDYFVSDINSENPDKMTIVAYTGTGVIISSTSGYNFNNLKLCELKFNNLQSSEIVSDLTIEEISIADFNGNQLVESFTVLTESLDITAIKPLIQINSPTTGAHFSLGETVGFQVGINNWNDSLGSLTASGVVISDILDQDILLNCSETVCIGSGALQVTGSGGYFDFEVKVSNKMGNVSTETINIEVKAPLVNIDCAPDKYIKGEETIFTCESINNVFPELYWSYAEKLSSGSGWTVISFGSGAEIVSSFSGTYINDIEVFGENPTGTGYTLIHAKNRPEMTVFYKYKFQGGTQFSEVSSASGSTLYFGQNLDYQFRYETTDLDQEEYTGNILLTAEELNGLDPISIVIDESVLTPENGYFTEIKVTASGSFILKATAVDIDGFNGEKRIKIESSNTPRLVSSVLWSGEFVYGAEVNESLALTKSGNFKFFNVEDNDGGSGSGEVLLANIGLTLSEEGEITGQLERVGNFTTVVRIEEYNDNDGLEDAYLDVLEFKGYIDVIGEVKNTLGNALTSAKVALIEYNEDFEEDRNPLEFFFINSNSGGRFDFNQRLYGGFGDDKEEPEVERYQLKIEAGSYEDFYTDENWNNASYELTINKNGNVDLGTEWQEDDFGINLPLTVQPEEVTVKLTAKDITGRVFKGIRLVWEGFSLTGQNYVEDLSCLTDDDGECVMTNITRPSGQELKMSYKKSENDPIQNKHKDVFEDITQDITISTSETFVDENFVLTSKPVALKIKVVSEDNPEEDRLLGININAGTENVLSDELFIGLVPETVDSSKGKFTVGNSYNINITDPKGFYHPISFMLKIPTGMYTLGWEGETIRKLMADFTGGISNTITQIAGKDHITKDGNIIVSEISDKYSSGSYITIDNVENYGDRIVIALKAITDRECTIEDISCSESCGGGVYKLKEGLMCVEGLLGKACNTQSCGGSSGGWGWGGGGGNYYNVNALRTGRVNTLLQVEDKKLDFGHSRVQGRSSYQITGEKGEIVMIGEKGNIEFRVYPETTVEFEKWSALLNDPEYSSLIDSYDNKPVASLVKVSNKGLIFSNPFQLTIKNIGDDYKKEDIRVVYGETINELKKLSSENYEIANGTVVIKFDQGRYFAVLAEERLGVSLYSLKKSGLGAYLDYIYSRVVVFRDIMDHWSKGYVSELQYMWLIGGYQDGTFKPNNYINRAELLKMVILATQKTVESSGENTFVDVNPEDWFADYVKSAKRYEIIDGYKVEDQEFFYPERNITRAEALKIVMESFNVELEVNQDFIARMVEMVEDVYDEDWYAQYVAWGVSRGIIKSFTEDPNIYFRPNEFVTRAEAVEMIVLVNNFYQRILAEK